MKTKVCVCCGEEKALDSFYKHKSYKLGRFNECIKCTSDRRKDEYSKKSRIPEGRKYSQFGNFTL